MSLNLIQWGSFSSLLGWKWQQVPGCLCAVRWRRVKGMMEWDSLQENHCWRRKSLYESLHSLLPRLIFLWRSLQVFHAGGLVSLSVGSSDTYQVGILNDIKSVRNSLWQSVGFKKKKKSWGWFLLFFVFCLNQHHYSICPAYMLPTSQVTSKPPIGWILSFLLDALMHWIWPCYCIGCHVFSSVGLFFPIKL